MGFLYLSLDSRKKAHVISKDSDQTARMRSLIWVFAGRTSLIVCFVVRWDIYNNNNNNNNNNNSWFGLT